MNDRDRVIIKKILGYCNEIKQTHEFFKNDKEAFNSEEGFVYRNSITMPILQIGELTKNLSEEFRTEHSAIPWKSIAGMRDVFAHHYGSIDYEMVWNTSVKDLADLESFCKSIIK
jgi:uncharacterized protein with HEPN domain